MPPVLLPYQGKWVKDTSRVKVCSKSRRIGISWADASISALDAAYMYGCDTFYIGYNKDMAEQYITDTAFWATNYQLAASAIEEDVLKDEKEDILVFRVRFASGFKVLALSSRPSNLRAKKGKIVIDEAAFHQDLDQLIKAAMAILAWGGQVRIISTHDGASNPFNLLCEEIRTRTKDFSLHNYTIDDALIDGLYQRICLVNRTVYSRELERAWRHQLFKDYGRHADEELLCIPTSSSDSLFDAAMVDKLAVGKWIRQRQAGHHYLIGVDPNFGGADFWVTQVWDITKIPFVLVEEYRAQNKSTTHSRGETVKLINKYKPVITAVESNSGGTVVAENLQTDCKSARIELTRTTKASKIINTDRIAMAIDQSEVIYPNDWSGITEMKNFGATSREAITGHDDTVMGWASAFAWLEDALKSRRSFSWMSA